MRPTFHIAGRRQLRQERAAKAWSDQQRPEGQRQRVGKYPADGWRLKLPHDSRATFPIELTGAIMVAKPLRRGHNGRPRPSGDCEICGPPASLYQRPMVPFCVIFQILPATKSWLFPYTAPWCWRAPST